MPNSYSTTAKKLKLAKKDILLVEQFARFVIVVDHEGYPLCSWENNSFKLNVLAIIGHTVINEVETIAVLMEIGIWRTRPYNPSKIYHRRRQYSFLGMTRLKNVLTLIEDILNSVYKDYK